MESSRDCSQGLLPDASALQHEPAPRPLPLFLELVRAAAKRDPKIAREALDGLTAYAQAPRVTRSEIPTEAGCAGPATLRDHGGIALPVVLVPSLINPPHILDLDQHVSLTSALRDMGRRVLLVDWGPAADREHLSVSDHVERLLVPLLRQLGGEPPALLGYCLGGTMAIAAANLVPLERLVTLAAPWHFSRYPEEARAAIGRIWKQSQPAAQAFRALPMEVLQAAFWSLDPERTVAKFAAFAAVDSQSAQGQRFVALEDWANEGEPLPYPAARELMEDLFEADLPGTGAWSVSGRVVTDRLTCPTLHLTAERDRIAPAVTAPEGRRIGISAGHVGMVVGSSREQLHRELRRFLTPNLAAEAEQG